MKKYTSPICFTLVSMLFIQCSGEKTVTEEVIRPVKVLIVGTRAETETRTFTGVAKA